MTLASDICQISTHQGVGQMADEHGFALILIRGHECNATLLAMIWKDQLIQLARLADALAIALRAVLKRYKRGPSFNLALATHQQLK